MNQSSFKTYFFVNESAEKVFAAINNVHGWWSEEIEGSTNTLGAKFKYHFSDVHLCTIKITELVPNKKVTWHVIKNYFKFTKDSTEWTDTDIIFEITEENGKTKLQFTHRGLVPEYECFDICTNAWNTYINGSLKNLITTGKGEPNSSQRARTETEAEMMESE